MVEKWERELKWLFRVIEQIEEEKEEAQNEVKLLKHRVKVLKDSLNAPQPHTAEAVLWGDPDSGWAEVSATYKCRKCGFTAVIDTLNGDYSSMIHHSCE